MLARDDLKVRPGLAGPPYETPGAQCQGEQSFRYALMLHPGDWANAGVAAQARAFCGPPLLALCPDGELSQNEGPCGDSLGSLPQGYWTSALMADSGGRAICRAVNGSDIPLSPPEGETIDLSGAATSVPAMVAAGGLVTTVLDTKEG